MAEPLFHQIDVACAPDLAFRIFTARLDLWWPKGHRRFEGSRLSLDPVVGGKLLETAPDGQTAILAEVTACTPPGSLDLLWFPGQITGPTRVEIRFSGTDTLTRVSVTHFEGEAQMGDRWPERAALFNRGWQTVLPAFAKHIETGD